MQFPSWRDQSWLPYCWAVCIFCCSRAVVALGLVFSRKYMTNGAFWSAGQMWYHQLLQWDSESYFKIVTEGYRYNGDPSIQQNTVFHPLYPMLARGLVTISGLVPADALLLISNVAALFAIVVLFKLVREQFDDQCRARHHRAAQLFSGFGVAVGRVHRTAGTAADRRFLPGSETKKLSVGRAARRPRHSRSVHGNRPVARPAPGDLVQSRPKAVPCRPPALRPARDRGDLAVHDLSLERFRNAVCSFGRADGVPSRNDPGGATDRGAQTRAIHPNDPRRLESVGAGQLVYIVVHRPDCGGLVWNTPTWTLFAIGVFLLPYLTLSGGPAGFVSMSRFNLVSFPLLVVLAHLGWRAR
jgi:hypothetical protein